MSILDKYLASAPVAVVDCESTGLSSSFDRICEISVVHLDPAQANVEVVIDTIINPNRKMKGTNIHGLSQADVEQAPTFDEIAGDIVDALAERVIVAHNTSFDVRFLRLELERLGLPINPPTVCTMSLRPLLSLGTRVSLEAACAEYGIPITRPHAAGADAMATAHLYLHYLREAARKKAKTFSQLASIATLQKKPKLAESWRLDFLHHGMGARLSRSGKRFSRWGTPGGNAPVSDADPSAIYAHAVHEVLADFYVTVDEIRKLNALKEKYQMREEQVRAVHAAVFSWLLTTFGSDGWLDDSERDYLMRVRDCLRNLGWAPGD